MGDLLDIPISGTTKQVPANEPAPNQANVNPVISPPPPVTPAAAAASVIPDVGEIEKTLQESGKLLNEIGINPKVKVDTSPLAALQPQNMLLTKSGPQPVRLPSEHQLPLLGINLASSGNRIHFRVNLRGIGQQIIKWLLVTLYAALGSFSLLKTINFFFSEFPQLEKSQAILASAESQLNSLLILNFVIFITSILLMFMAIQLIRGKTLSLSFLGLGLMVAVVCLISNTQVGIAQANRLNTNGNKLSNQTKSFFDSLLDTMPFLKRQEDGTVTPVWYKDITQPY